MTCARCGATIGDRMTHLAWHATHDDLENRLAEFEDARDAKAFATRHSALGRSASEPVPPSAPQQ